MSSGVEFPDIYIEDGLPVEVHGYLGSGGSKTVWDVSVSGLRRALAIPNCVDSRSVQDEKWRTVADEPANAARLRELGLLVIPEYTLGQACIDGDHRPFLAMTPFSELPFKVLDAKDGASTYYVGPLSDLRHYSEMIERVLPVGRDIETLVAAGIVLESDSISFAVMPNRTLRLFFYDLQEMSTVRSSDVLDKLANTYAQLVVSKLDNVLDFGQLRQFEEEGYDFEARQQLASRLATLRLCASA